MMDTEVQMETKTYDREQYACHLRIKPSRLEADDLAAARSERDRIVNVMTRWLRRCVRDQPIVIGTAQITAARDLWSKDGFLRAVAPAYRDVVDERDATVLRSMVDSERGQRVVIPRLLPMETA